MSTPMTTTHRLVREWAGVRVETYTAVNYSVRGIMGLEVELERDELRLLELLLDDPYEAVTYDVLVRELGLVSRHTSPLPTEWEVAVDHLRLLAASLRSKLTLGVHENAPFKPKLIESWQGIGYRFCSPS
jgi:DNA-binding response OmpR family regulator